MDSLLTLVRLMHSAARKSTSKAWCQGKRLNSNLDYGFGHCCVFSCLHTHQLGLLSTHFLVWILASVVAGVRLKMRTTQSLFKSLTSLTLTRWAWCSAVRASLSALSAVGATQPSRASCRRPRSRGAELQSRRSRQVARWRAGLRHALGTLQGGAAAGDGATGIVGLGYWDFNGKVQI